MRSNHVGLKNSRSCWRRLRLRSESGDFQYQFLFFQTNISSIKIYRIPTAQKHLIWLYFVIKLQVSCFFIMILDKGSFGNIIRTHVLTRVGRRWRHTKIHELMRMAEAMRREDKPEDSIFCKTVNSYGMKVNITI